MPGSCCFWLGTTQRWTCTAPRASRSPRPHVGTFQGQSSDAMSDPRVSARHPSPPLPSPSKLVTSYSWRTGQYRQPALRQAGNNNLMASCLRQSMRQMSGKLGLARGRYVLESESARVKGYSFQAQRARCAIFWIKIYSEGVYMKVRDSFGQSWSLMPEALTSG